MQKNKNKTKQEDNISCRSKINMVVKLDTVSIKKTDPFINVSSCIF